MLIAVELADMLTKAVQVVSKVVLQADALVASLFGCFL